MLVLAVVRRSIAAIFHVQGALVRRQEVVRLQVGRQVDAAQFAKGDAKLDGP
jgi:hypothetical protein